MNVIHALAFTVISAALVASTISSAASAAEPFRIATPGAGYPTVAPVVAGSELGYFSANGIAVEVTDFRSGADAEESLLTGDSDVANIGFQTLAASVQKGVKIRCVAPTTNGAAGWALLTPAKSNVSNVKQLAGARVGITSKGSFSDFLATWLQASASISADEIPLGAANSLIGAADSGQIAATIAWSPNSERLVKNGQMRMLVDFGRKMPRQYVGCWAALDDAVNKRPDVFRKFTAAYLKTVAYMKAKPDYSVNFLMKFMDEPDRSLISEVYRDFFPIMLTTTTVEQPVLTETLQFNRLPAMPAAQLFNEKIYTLPRAASH